MVIIMANSDDNAEYGDYCLIDNWDCSDDSDDVDDSDDSDDYHDFDDYATCHDDWDDWYGCDVYDGFD